jgi:hypothetical protein
MNKKRLVFDVEFAAENWEDFDEITQKDLMKRVPDKKSDPKGYERDPTGKQVDIEEGDIKYVPMTEAEILIKFWAIAETTDEFISFFGRRSDVPYINIRSAVHGIRPSKDLLSNRYNSSRFPGALHWDLAELLTFYGSAMYKGSLHRWCRAFGIESPKGEMDGSQVGEYFKAGKGLEIAKYNVADLKATTALFHKWDQYLRERV